MLIALFILKMRRFLTETFMNPKHATEKWNVCASRLELHLNLGATFPMHLLNLETSKLSRLFPNIAHQRFGQLPPDNTIWVSEDIQAKKVFIFENSEPLRKSLDTIFRHLINQCGWRRPFWLRIWLIDEWVMVSIQYNALNVVYERELFPAAWRDVVVWCLSTGEMDPSDV